ncbi:gamma-glutamylcyclotransferase [Alphaproteobacteria bacterium GH1-50]|uniref:glutathione-specific gamma-glutamylcyclotransferase n=1 Tax=Kangsaoukella pontilimi TaxID=2691042 RepID=A0A7C9ISY3_9RHOB|nr:gamma-glutamylcyclotransferase family protein [Kangsaoukella pontilimi]MXQ09086.1 gamma-glutamylcyclotransferase [Kangsaoukella pontilimi]
MTHPWFFGYGSLVNRRTHDYAVAAPARITGWRRTWRHVATRNVAFLTAYPSPGSVLDGLIAEVPRGDWEALDMREHSYLREAATGVAHALPTPPEIHIYHAPPDLHAPASDAHPVLLSYLDTVIQGYLTEFGETGVRDFFDTTDGWDAPIRDDRSAPVYPRAQETGPEIRDIVNTELARVGARIRA